MYCPLDDRNPHWCVVKTKPRWEQRVAERLEAGSVPAYAPRMVRVEGAPKKLRYEKPQCLFPGYVFVRLSPAECLQRMQWQPGVRGVLHLQGQVAALTDGQVRAIREKEGDGGLIAVAAPPLTRGQRICVVEGVFEGLQGLFERYLQGEERVRILLRLISGELPLELDRSLVAPSDS